MNNCKDCNCNCHCNVKGHSDLYGVCPCENCKCKKEKEVVVDDSNECLSCQQEGETMAKKKKKKGKKKNKKNKKKKR